MTLSLNCCHNLKQRVSVLLTCCLLAACQPSGRLSPLGTDATILAFGDSLTYGTGVAEGEAYPAVLAEILDTPVIRSGVPGEVSSAGLQRLGDEIRRHQPDLVLICHGGNDVLRRMSGSATKSNLRAMVELSRDSGAEVVVLAVPQLSLFPKAASYYKELEAELNVPVEYEILSRLQSDNSKKSDQVHFNATGYKEMAQAVFDLLEAEGAI